MSTIRVVAIGAAVQDVFLHGRLFTPKKELNGDQVEEFVLGSKNEVEKVTFSTGGGATNAAVTFARQGMHSMYMGAVGRDVAGTAVVDALHAEGVDTSLLTYSQEHGTGYSVLLLSPGGERTILVYRGASVHYELTEEDFHHTRPEWIYLTSMEGNFKALTAIMRYAHHHQIKVAINPGKMELADKEKLLDLLPFVTLLGLNKDEAQTIFAGETVEQLVVNAAKVVPYVVITDGAKGVGATDGAIYVQAGMYDDVEVVDRTGAGDAFNSGFTAMIAKGEKIEEAVRFASANATSVVAKVGAKEGILHDGVKLHHMEMRTKPFLSDKTLPAKA